MKPSKLGDFKVSEYSPLVMFTVIQSDMPGHHDHWFIINNECENNFI